MRTVMVSAAVVAAMFASVPLAAQSNYGNGWQHDRQQQGQGWDSGRFWRGAPQGTWERIQFLQLRIDSASRDGSLDRREARRANRELRSIRMDAQRLRNRYRGNMRSGDNMAVQARLDNLSRNLRWMRHDQSWSSGYGFDDRSGRDGYGYGSDYAYRTDYDAQRYYRDGPQYQERRLSAQDEVYRGSDGRYYCKRNDGTTGLIVGGVAGGVAGNLIDGGHNRLAGTLIGGALGALAGKAIEQNGDVRCR